MSSSRSNEVSSSKQTRTNPKANASKQVPDRQGSDNELEESPSLRSIKNEIAAYSRKNKDDSTTFFYYPGIQRNEYDYQEERHHLVNTNLVESTAHLIKGSLAVGVLSMHEAYMFAGIWSSLIGNVIIGCINYHITKMLIDSAHVVYQRLKVPKLSYSALGEAAVAMGPSEYLRKHRKAFRRSIAICLFMEMSSSCCVYQIVAAHTLKRVLGHYVHRVFDNIRSYIFINTPILVMFCMIRSFKHLARFSFIADVFIGVCVFTTLHFSLKTAGKLSERPAWKDFYGFFKFFGICLYCTCGITMALPVENNMSSPKLLGILLRFSVPLTTACAMATGFFGYWGWGEECESPITEHMPDNMYTTILQIMLLIMFWVTFALKFYVPFEIVWYCLRKMGTSKKVKWELFFRFLYVCFLTMVSVLYPNLVDFMVFVGNFWLGITLFIFPAIIEYSVTWESDHQNNIKWRRNKNIFLISFGAFCSSSALLMLLFNFFYVHVQ